MQTELNEQAVQAAVGELAHYCELARITLPPGAVDLLTSYLSLLLQWGGRMSLTGAKTARELALAHVYDCLHLAPQLALGEAIADLGSGAGLPGIPLAIARPDCAFTLIEARRKRASFLRHVVRQLQLTNIQVQEARAEDLARRLRRTFDVVVARAVADLATLVRLALPLLKCHGRLIVMKGPKPEGELQVLVGPIRPVRIERYHLPERWGERTLVILTRS